MDSRWKAYLYLAPAMIMFALFTLYPVGRSIQMSFQDYEFLRPERATYNGLGNYREAIVDPTTQKAFVNTMYFTVLFLPIYVLGAMPIAFVIDRLRRQVLLRIVTFLPVVVSGAVVAVLWTTLYHGTYGPFTAAANALGLENVSFLGETKTAMPSLVAMGVWHGIGFNVLLYLVRLAAIPQDLYEAAAVDGAGAWRTFWSVTLPLLKPAIYLVTVLGLIGSLKVFGPMFIMTKGGPANSTLSVVMHLYKQAFTSGNLRFGYAAAIAVMLALIIMTFAILASRLNRPVDR